MGKICMGDDNVVALLVNYYQESFSSSTLGDMESTLQWVPHVVTDDMNSILMGNFSKQEVDFALKQMAPLKAPGHDGMLSIFFPTLLESHWKGCLTSSFILSKHGYDSSLS